MNNHLGELLDNLRFTLFLMIGGQYLLSRQARRRQAALERIFMACMVMDLAGIPLVPPGGTLRLLPYLVPGILMWKRRLLYRDTWPLRLDMLE